jgi:hypothetical protein
VRRGRARAVRERWAIRAARIGVPVSGRCSDVDLRVFAGRNNWIESCRLEGRGVVEPDGVEGAQRGRAL